MADYTKFTVSSKKDTASGAYALEDYDRDLRKLRNAIKSTLPEGTNVFESEKAINARSGRMTQAFYVPAEYATNISKVLNTLSSKLLYDGGDVKYKATRARKLNDADEEFLRNKNKEDSKEKTAVALFTKASFLKVIAILTTIGETVRRIFSAVLDLSTKTVKDMETAHNLGLSYDYVRKAGYTETAHGMKEGTITEAITEIQSKFGNITKLDETAISDLALVMGGKVEELVKSGLGSSDPDKLLGTIIDSFNERANAGYNSIGQYVGEQQARRELYSYLLKISPTWADIFATMQEEQHNINSIFRDQAETFEQWKNLTPANRDFGQNSIDRNVTATLGQEWNLVRSEIQQVKDAIMTSLAPQLLSILRWIENWRFGLSETENRRLNAKNKALNLAEIERVSGVLEEMEEVKDTLNPSEIAYYAEMKEYKKALEDANKGDSKGNIRNATRTPEEIRQDAVEDLRTLLTSPDNIARAVLGDLFFELSPLKHNFLHPNYEEMKRAVADYGMDIQPDVEEYGADIIERNNAKIKERNKKVEKEVKARENKQRSQIAKEAGTKESGFLLTGEKRIKQMLDFLGSTLKEQNLPLPEFLTDSNLTQAQKRDQAIKEGYFTSSTNSRFENDNWTPHINPDKLIDREAIEEQVKQAIPVPSLESSVPEDYIDSDDFWKYLYTKHTYWFGDKVNNMLADKYAEESEKNNKWAGISLVNQQIQEIAQGFGAGASGYITQSTSMNGGETTHNLVLTIKDTKGRTETFDLGSFKGMVGSDSVTNIYVDDTGDVHYQSTDTTAGMGTSASGGI